MEPYATNYARSTWNAEENVLLVCPEANEDSMKCWLLGVLWDVIKIETGSRCAFGSLPPSQIPLDIRICWKSIYARQTYQTKPTIYDPERSRSWPIFGQETVKLAVNTAQNGGGRKVASPCEGVASIFKLC